MLLFRPFLSHFTRKLRHKPTELEETIAKCLDAAVRTIEVIHDIYRIHTFFRCWYAILASLLFLSLPLPYPCPCSLEDRWYNVTYVMFATSTLLLPMSKLGLCAETIPLQRSVEMAMEILDAMDESVVARKSVDIIKHYLREFRASDVQSASASASASMVGPDMEGDTATFASETVPSQEGFDIPVFSTPPCSVSP